MINKILDYFARKKIKVAYVSPFKSNQELLRAREGMKVRNLYNYWKLDEPERGVSEQEVRYGITLRQNDVVKTKNRNWIHNDSKRTLKVKIQDYLVK